MIRRCKSSRASQPQPVELLWVVIVACFAVNGCAADSTDGTEPDPAGDAGGGDSHTAGDTGGGDSYAPGDPALPQWTCIAQPSGAFPRRLELHTTDDNGVFDISFARDPASSRLWMAFSSVDGPAGTGHVSTNLAYSDDAGVSWCSRGPLNAATEVATEDLPGYLTAGPAHWNHETSTLVYDAGAPPAERWMIFWHRYLELLNGDPEPRRFVHGWLAMKAAATPELLFDALEQKWISTVTYHTSANGIESYNDSVGGPPQVRLDSISGVNDCLIVTEPGALGHNGDLYVAMMCAAAGDGSANRIELMRLNRSGSTAVWEHGGTLMDQAMAQSVLETGLQYACVAGCQTQCQLPECTGDCQGTACGTACNAACEAVTTPALKGGSAVELYTVAGEVRASITPVVNPDGYRGCWIYGVELGTGTLLGMGTNPPLPLSAVPHTEGSILSGMCTHIDSLAGGGLWFGSAHFAEANEVQFRVWQTTATP